MGINKLYVDQDEFYFYIKEKKFEWSLIADASDFVYRYFVTLMLGFICSLVLFIMIFFFL